MYSDVSHSHGGHINHSIYPPQLHIIQIRYSQGQSIMWNTVNEPTRANGNIMA